MNKELYKLSYTLKKQRQHKIVTIVLFALVIFTSIMLVRTFFIFAVRQHSISMQPDIPYESNILFTPIIGTPERGSVVLLKSRSEGTSSLLLRAADTVISFFSAQQLSLFDRGRLMGSYPQIRRIIGLPGDTIYMRGYVLFVQPAGQKHFLTEFECVKNTYNVTIVAAPSGWDSTIGISGRFEKIHLGRDEYFVLGDNRCSCVDSRLWGPVNIKNIKAKGLAVSFPFSKLRLL